MRRSVWFFVVFCCGFVGYPLLELAARGYTHISMALAGGICACLVARVAETRLPLVSCAAVSAVLITAVELLFGVVCNLILRLGVWDYSRLPLNLMGQVCLPFTGLWFLLSLPLTLLLRAVARRVTDGRASA